jgi:hexosaminidase
MAMHKLNVLHLHLTDDQGWRLEIKKYPRLTSVGAHRKETLAEFLNPNKESHLLPGNGIPHSGFYTQEEAREIVAYARERHIEVVPEIELPGHARAAIAAYPEFGTRDEAVEVGKSWGPHEDAFKPSPETFAFLEDILTEVMEIFPSTFIHIGGDEVIKDQWESSQYCQDLMADLGLKDTHELQSYFIRHFDAFLAGHGRRLVGWDEILEGGLAAGATVMSWRGEKGGIAAASAGHDVVMAPDIYTYLDFYQSADTESEPKAVGGCLPLPVAYGYEPIPAELPAEMSHHILGVQAQIWTEFMPTTEHLEYMTFPRLCALAEVMWTPPGRKDFDNFVRRLKTGHLQRLDTLGIEHKPITDERKI